MSRIVPPVCRLCRREGVKLMLKGYRCETAKCPMERQWRNAPPGMHPFRRAKGTEYAKRLREKQKVKRYYGVGERQFQRYFERASSAPGNTGAALLTLLERRLDNVVCKLNFAGSRRAARQSIVHRHIQVNGVVVDRPSYMVKAGDRIVVKTREISQKLVRGAVDKDPNRPVQPWLRVDPAALSGEIVALPSREDVQIPVEENLIVELCSR